MGAMMPDREPASQIRTVQKVRPAALEILSAQAGL
jgi:hypothetical protein